MERLVKESVSQLCHVISEYVFTYKISVTFLIFQDVAD